MINPEDARHAYYLFRALHDATCPKCGYSAQSFENTYGLHCPQCHFGMSRAECRGIQSLTGDVLKVRLDALERIRGELTELGEG